ncbi:MAG: glycoside hydrolase family 3 C-terminal domain-containing protein [Phycisphaerae bacterium]|nr:glycoside hydrolase family 3 C-terminal domain-containing protein [Phycisphaerae bacterium]
MMVVGFCTAQEVTLENAPFLDPAEPMDVRIADLISRMTLEEKISQLKYDADAVPRLGIAPYNWWNECLHGVARAGKATVFPQAIGLAATFDTGLVYDVASAISDEARVKFQQAQDEGNFARYRGLTFWTPNINIFRDPRWGRGQETYGEDPFLTSRMGTALVKGLQGDHHRYLKVAACAKHYAVHSGPEALRHEFDAVVSDKDLWETYLPAFHALVDAGVETVMGAYNRTNHEVCCGSSKLLMDILRGQWGFKGHVVSDCWALQDIHQTHLVTKTPEESAALALKSGTDLNCGSTYGPYLKKAVDLKLVTEADVDRALSRLLRTKMRLGLFDPPEMNPYTKIPASVLCSQAHKDLARQAAQKSIVLLKNKNQCLPLSKNPTQLYVVGPMAANVQPLLGNYYGLSDHLVTILEGIMNTVSPASTVQYRPGALLDHANVNPVDWYSGIAAEADVTIAVVGLDNMLEGEEGESLASPAKGDREDIQLPAHQLDLLKKLRKNARQLVVVVTGGSPIALGEVHDMADALVFAWYPGEQGGQAVADMLFGDVTPSGKLPLTFPTSVAQLPEYADYAMTGRTYRYMTAEPLYPFGFGLSYTQFEYSRPRLSLAEIKPGQSTQVTVTLTNRGELPGEEVAQLYITDIEASVPVPQYALKGFQRVSLEPGQRKTVTFMITPDMLTLVNQDGQSILEPGRFKITIGGSCPSPRAQALGAAKTVEMILTVGE